MVARPPPHLFGGCFRIWTPTQAHRNEHQPGHVGRRHPLEGRPRPRMVPAVAAGGLHVHHELRHGISNEDANPQRTQRPDVGPGVHLHHHPPVGPLGQLETPSNRRFRRPGGHGFAAPILGAQSRSLRPRCESGETRIGCRLHLCLVGPGWRRRNDLQHANEFLGGPKPRPG